MEIYLNEYICDQLELGYYPGVTTPREDKAWVRVGVLLGLREEWDLPHRELLAKFLIADRKLQIASTGRPGWWEVLNEPETTMEAGLLGRRARYFEGVLDRTKKGILKTLSGPLELEYESHGAENVYLTDTDGTRYFYKARDGTD